MEDYSPTSSTHTHTHRACLQCVRVSHVQNHTSTLQCNLRRVQILQRKAAVDKFAQEVGSFARSLNTSEGRPPRRAKRDIFAATWLCQVEHLVSTLCAKSHNDRLAGHECLDRLLGTLAGLLSGFLLGRLALVNTGRRNYNMQPRNNCYFLRGRLNVALKGNKNR